MRAKPSAVSNGKMQLLLS